MTKSRSQSYFEFLGLDGHPGWAVEPGRCVGQMLSQVFVTVKIIATIYTAVSNCIAVYTSVLALLARELL